MVRRLITLRGLHEAYKGLHYIVSEPEEPPSFSKKCLRNGSQLICLAIRIGHGLAVEIPWRIISLVLFASSAFAGLKPRWPCKRSKVISPPHWHVLVLRYSLLRLKLPKCQCLDKAIKFTLLVTATSIETPRVSLSWYIDTYH